MASIQEYLSKLSQSTLNNKKSESINEEINRAKHDWIAAEKKFNYAVDKDQIDFAIFSLEAAEKRYEMLLKQAKKMQTLNKGQMENILED
ncbi:DUF2508 family protein [Chengkuizengella axinellae]|uniref:DUF2508 family protein n=1 Tax=Chengkuizengella axinellae TaxID=3064388 RepID=A0ABT9J5F2_9BACL|nr:DUF2508 family protein [Chengkuizengella sp. 2205SS18-9]MDP5276844.1 DUF2508 family protein [Chengkuizengella sp. 2205SS18-9]